MQSQQIPDIPKIELDDEGYPTEESLDAIRRFRLESRGDRRQWEEAAIEILDDAMAKWWPREILVKVDYAKCDLLGDNVKRFTFATGGWSGNESIIRAFQYNFLLWNLYWVKSERGGIYTFEVPVGENDGD